MNQVIHIKDISAEFRTLSDRLRTRIAGREHTGARDEAGPDNAALASQLDRVEARLEDLQNHLDYVRHVSESTRATEAMLARRKVPVGPVKVLFLVHHPEAWYSLAAVHSLMESDPSFSVTVASVPRHFPGSTTFKDEESVDERLNHFHVKHVRFHNRDPFLDLNTVRMLDPDIIFRQSQWDGDVPNAFGTWEIRFSRLCLVPYEIMNLVHNIPEDDGLNTAVDSEFHRSAWAIFCANEAVKDIAAVESPSNAAEQYVVTGHPKADLLRSIDSSATHEPGHRYTVLWSAHHSIGTEWIGFGTFPESAPVMIDAARRHPEWDFVFSAHPALLTHLSHPEPPLTPELVDDFYAQWDALPNTSIFGGGDYAEVFGRSDVLISDGLSWIMEFQLTGKPVVFIERAGHREFNQMGLAVVRGTNVVPDTPGGIRAIEGLAAGGADSQREGQRALDQLIGGHGDAAQRILESIKSKLVVEGWQPV